MVLECALPQEFSDFNQINMDKDTLVTLGIMMEIASIAVFTVAFFVAIFSKDYRKKALITMVTCVITCIIGFGICANNFSLGAMH